MTLDGRHRLLPQSEFQNIIHVELKQMECALPLMVILNNTLLRISERGKSIKEVF